MISKPLKWRLHNNSYFGGNYRSDLSQIVFIHKSGLHVHNITGLDYILTTVNKLQVQKLHININLLNWLNKNTDLIKDKIDTQIFELANLYKDFSFYIPLYIDWRGRIYTSSNLLSYQGKSLAKS
jgi:hypothetical protein